MKRFFVLILGALFLFPATAMAGSIFLDVYDSEPVNTALEYLLEEEVVEGYGDGTFRPLSLINRAEFTKMVVEGVFGITPDETINKYCFSDVQDEWFAKYVCYAKSIGLVEGYEDGDFHPGDDITRTEALKIMGEAFEFAPLTDWSFTYSQFYDFDEDDWFYDYVRMAEERELLDTVDFYLSPHELISRRQMSEMLYRAMKYEDGESFETWSMEEDADYSYEEMLATGIEPAYPVDMEFPSNSQSGWTYGCYSFATKNIMEFKYDIYLDIAEVQESIGWDGSFIWSPTEFENFAANYDVDVIFSYNGTAEFLFKKLAMGEPLIVYIPYYIGEWNVGHQLVIYSFDENGVWAADSLSGGYQHHIDYADIFMDGAHFTTNLTELRSVKSGGQRKSQIGV